MDDQQIRLRDVIAAGHPDTALIGLPVQTIRSLIERHPQLAELPIVPYIGAVGAAA